MRNSGINWTHHTFNPWQGCTKVSPGCKHCYAEIIDKRNLHGTGSHWGAGAMRKVMSDEYWNQPLRWNKQAVASGERQRVFCASMADVFDDEAPEGQRERLWRLIRKTPSLDWLILTKRADNILPNLPDDWGSGCPNVWLGVSVENRKHGMPRIDVLRDIPAAVRFLSIEPLLEDLGPIDLAGIHWAIVGGESGNGARAFNVDWATHILDQCRQQGVRAWVKQLGRRPVSDGAELIIIGDNGRRSGHAGEFEEWPQELAHLRVRELPTGTQTVNGEHAKSAPKAIDPAIYLEQIDSELGRLASMLEPEAAKEEHKLRIEFIQVERRIFLTRAEKGRLLLGYKSLYGPRRLWSRFLRIVGLPRQTAYDLMSEATSENCTDFGQSRLSTGQKVNLHGASSTERLRSVVERNLAKLPQDEQMVLVRELAIRFGFVASDLSSGLPSTSVAKVVEMPSNHGTTNLPGGRSLSTTG